MNNKVYDVLKLIAQIILPLASMVVAILGVLGYANYGEMVLAIATAFNTFLGVLLKVLSDQFWKGKEIVEVSEDEEDEEVNG